MEGAPLNRNRRSAATINITPLVDVLLILVVLLMLTLPLQVKKLPVELPRTALGGEPTPQKSLPVAITAEGKLLVGANPIALPDLLLRVTGDTTVELAIDESVTYARIAEVVSALQGRQPREVVLITR